jgi:hypothetical protein
VPRNVCGDFWSVRLILLMALFFVCCFSRTTRIVYAFVVGGVILIVCAYLIGLEVGMKLLICDGHDWACKCWSARGMSEHKSPGPLKGMFDIFCRYTNMR